MRKKKKIWKALEYLWIVFVTFAFCTVLLVGLARAIEILLSFFISYCR